MTDDETYKKAIELWGINAQYDMVVEEAGEMLAALNQMKRGRIPFEDFIEECADVYIMIQQMRTLDPELFDSKVEEKITRLELRIKEYDDNE